MGVHGISRGVSRPARTEPRWLVSQAVRAAGVRAANRADVRQDYWVESDILVVADPAASRDFWVGVLGAELFREYGGTSVVLKFVGTWLLLVSGGGPTADKPGGHLQAAR